MDACKQAQSIVDAVLITSSTKDGLAPSDSAAPRSWMSMIETIKKALKASPSGSKLVYCEDCLIRICMSTGRPVAHSELNRVW